MDMGIENKTNTRSNLPIFRDEGFSFFYNKTEKIVTALYMVTNFMSVKEPLKWQIRSLSLKLLGEVMSFSRVSLSERSSAVINVQTLITESKSLFDIAYRSGFISKMNFDIISEQICLLLDFVLEYNSSGASIESTLFEKSFFNVSFKYKGQERERAPDQNSKLNNNLYGSNNDGVKNKINNSESKIKSNKDVSNRREKVLAIIKDKGEVTVKDISRAISGVSEKTLQRELLSMVSVGLIKKEGERRWSKYSIKI